MISDKEYIKSLLVEAFSVFPKSEKEISNPDIKKIFKAVKSNSDIPDPISLDPGKKNFVNVTRKLKNDSKVLSALKKLFNLDISKTGSIRWNGLTVKFGEGSRGGRGVKSKGLGFEKTLAGDLKRLQAEGVTKDNLKKFKHPKLIQEMANELGLKKGNFQIKEEGNKNQSRPLIAGSSGPEIGFSNNTIAETLTDVTIIKGGKSYFISAKFGGTLTFFNSGVMKIFPPDEIKSGKISNKFGIQVLNMLGIDNELFCKVFNKHGKVDFSNVKTNKRADIAKLQNLISSGIGEGYYYAQVGKGDDLFFKVDKKYNKYASQITSPVKVHYGGLDGKGKRVDVTFESNAYKFKINIRNKQGGLYPTHIMCDYVKKA